MSLDTSKNTNYSFWKVAKVARKPPDHIFPLRRQDGTWAKSEQERADVFADRLQNTFQTNYIDSDLHPVTKYNDGPSIKPITPKEIRSAIDKLNLRKAPGLDLVDAKILKEVPKKALVMIAYRRCHEKTSYVSNSASLLYRMHGSIESRHIDWKNSSVCNSDFVARMLLLEFF